MPTFKLDDVEYPIKLHFGNLNQIREAGYDLLADAASVLQTVASPRAVVTILHLLCNPKEEPEAWAARFADLDTIERGGEAIMLALADFVGDRGRPLRAAVKRIQETKERILAAVPEAEARVLTVPIVLGGSPGDSPEPSASDHSTDSRSGSSSRCSSDGETLSGDKPPRS